MRNIILAFCVAVSAFILGSLQTICCHAQSNIPPLYTDETFQNERRLIFRRAFEHAYKRMLWDNPKSEEEAERLMAKHFNRYPGITALQARPGKIVLEKTGSLLDRTFYFGVTDRLYGVRWWATYKNGYLTNWDTFVNPQSVDRR